MLIPNLNLLAVIPMIVLLFIKNPQPRIDNAVDPQICNRCNTALTPGSKFCTSCGWELSTVNSTDGPVEKEAPANVIVEEPREPTEATDIPTQETGDREVQAPAHVVPSEATTEPAAEAAAEPPTPERVLPRKPVPVDAPTAAVMTERGVRLYNQGRTQESIDQFTKAIALDPNYAQAWGRRAEAYAALGRGDEAAEDRRKLEALNPGSMGG